MKENTHQHNLRRQKEIFGFNEEDAARDRDYSTLRKAYAWIGFFVLAGVIVWGLVALYHWHTWAIAFINS